MKKNKIIISIFVIVSLITLKGCILDAFDTLTQNVPISKEFTVQGSGSVSETNDFCLSSSSIIKDYGGKIENIELITATYQTKNINPESVKGDLKISLAKWDGTELYSFTLTNISPADYKNTPYILQFSEAQIKAINNYLASLKDGTCFRVSLSVNNISPANTQITFTGKIDIAFKMKANP